jgi:hypothetical protein
LSSQPYELSVRDLWLRRSVAAAWLLLFAMGSLAVASSWDRLVGGLVEPPLPSHPEAPSLAPAPSAGERAVAEARRLLDGGNPSEAMSALQSVKPEEPVYPFALQLREEARRALPSVVP